MTETAIVRRSNQTIRRPSRKKEIKPSGGFYKAGGNEVPDARRVQQDANEKNIPYEIMNAEQTSDYAQVIVRAWAPNGQYIDDIVHHDFANIQQLKALELLKKEVKGEDIYFDDAPIQVFQDLTKPFNNDGTPILTGQGYLKLLTEMARFKNFAIRDATTKAARRAQLKVLNKEWRNKGEIQAEKDEVKQVQQSQQEQKKTRRRTISKTPAGINPDTVQDAEVTPKPETEQVDMTQGDRVNLNELKGINKELDKWIEMYKDSGPTTIKQVCDACQDFLSDQKMKPAEFREVKKKMGMKVK